MVFNGINMGKTTVLYIGKSPIEHVLVGISWDQIFINEGFVEFTKGKTKLAIVSEGTSSLIACQKYISFGCIAEVSSWISERPVRNGSFPNVGSTKRS